MAPNPNFDESSERVTVASHRPKPRSKPKVPQSVHRPVVPPPVAPARTPATNGAHRAERSSVFDKRTFMFASLGAAALIVVVAITVLLPSKPEPAPVNTPIAPATRTGSANTLAPTTSGPFETIDFEGFREEVLGSSNRSLMTDFDRIEHQGFAIESLFNPFKADFINSSKKPVDKRLRFSFLKIESAADEERSYIAAKPNYISRILSFARADGQLFSLAAVTVIYENSLAYTSQRFVLNAFRDDELIGSVEVPKREARIPFIIETNFRGINRFDLDCGQDMDGATPTILNFRVQYGEN